MSTLAALRDEREAGLPRVADIKARPDTLLSVCLTPEGPTGACGTSAPGAPGR